MFSRYEYDRENYKEVTSARSEEIRTGKVSYIQISCHKIEKIVSIFRKHWNAYIRHFGNNVSCFHLLKLKLFVAILNENDSQRRKDAIS